MAPQAPRSGAQPLSSISGGAATWLDTGVKYRDTYRFVCKFIPTLGPYTLAQARAVDSTLEKFTNMVFGVAPKGGDPATHRFRVYASPNNSFVQLDINPTSANQRKRWSVSPLLGHAMTVDVDPYNRAYELIGEDCNIHVFVENLPSSGWTEREYNIYLFSHNYLNTPRQTTPYQNSTVCSFCAYDQADGGAPVIELFPHLVDGEPVFIDRVTGNVYPVNVPAGGYVSYEL